MLKDDKKVMHGRYIKYRIDPGRKAILMVGQYNHNVQSGTWYLFDPAGEALKARGSFEDGKKQGLWEEFYNPEEPDDFSLENLFNNEGDVILDTDDAINIDVENLKLSAEGNYDLGKKTGRWTYYSFSGQVIHIFDHSNDKIVKNYLYDPIPYLGGLDRLLDRFFIELQQRDIMLENSSKLVVEIQVYDSSPVFKIVSSYGDQSFKNHVLEVLPKIPDDWIPSLINKKGKKPLLVAEYNLIGTTGNFSVYFNYK